MYTRALLEAVINPPGEVNKPEPIPWMVLDLIKAPRCPFYTSRCSLEEPPLVEVGKRTLDIMLALQLTPVLALARLYHWV
ncbi:MAG: hypothetical protein ACO2O2_05265 [Acidilobaceae archaeon]